MKKQYVKIEVSALTALQNEITMLRQRLEKYEKPEKKIRLLDDHGRPAGHQGPVHPFAKGGIKSKLEDLPDTFNREMALAIGISVNNLALWKWRKYITLDETGYYHKTPIYLKRLEQAKLVELDGERVANIVTEGKE